MKNIVLYASCALLLSSCRFFGGEKINGDGRIVVEQRQVGNFDGVEVSGAIAVEIRQDAAHGVRVEVDQNLQEFIRTEVEDGVLRIFPEKNTNPQPTKKLVVYVAAPVFRQVEVSGASSLQTAGLISGSEELELRASGASEVSLRLNVSSFTGDISGATTLKLQGRAEDFSLEASGSSDVEGFELITENAALDLSGASNVKITANKRIQIDASGASDVEYKGSPSVEQNSGGASSVKKVG